MHSLPDDGICTLSDTLLLDNRNLLPHMDDFLLLKTYLKTKSHLRIL